MNTLVVGSNTEPLLDFITGRYLIIDDGALIDALNLPQRRSITVFNPAEHAFNPLKGIDYRKAREFVSVLNSVFPEGENTLTRKSTTYVLLKALLSKPRSLETLVSPKDEDAYQKIQTLLLSPVLKNVLTRPTNLSFKGTILARLNRAELGEFDCFVLANLLISQYPGTVVIPDFGFYTCPFHVSLIRQNRLVAGIQSFDEVPGFKSKLLAFPTKLGSRCTPEDAKLLALYAGLHPDPTREDNPYNHFIQQAIS